MTESKLAANRAARSTQARLGPLSARAALVVLYLVIALVALGALSMFVFANPLPAFDLSITRAVQSFHPTWWDTLMRAVGEPGYPPQVYVLVVWIFIVLFGAGLKWEAMGHAFGTVLIGIAGLAIKTPIDRPRPSPQIVQVFTPGLEGGKMSYPAGHVESYVVIFGFLIFLLIVLGRPSWLRTLEIVFFGLLLALIGISRIYTGEHWFTDVIGGYLLGTIVLIATIRFYQWGRDRFFVHERGRTATAEQ